jgi:hypothetical protein
MQPRLRHRLLAPRISVDDPPTALAKADPRISSWAFLQEPAIWLEKSTARQAWQTGRLCNLPIPAEDDYDDDKTSRV